MILKLAKLIFYSYFVLYAFLHVLVFLNPGIINNLVFMNSVRWPFGDLTRPSEYGLNYVHNFYITNKQDNVRLGVWHFIPKFFKYDPSKDSSSSVDHHLKNFLKSSDEIPVIIYVHGNDRDRSAPFRINLCNNLLNLGYHVFAIDYRGFGDSSGTPTEAGVTSDVIALYDLIVLHKPNAKIFFYGHSLGTGIVSNAARKMSENNKRLDGVILEAPFLNSSLASQDYHISQLFANNNWIRNRIYQALEDNNIRFRTDQNILKIKTRILIFHAEDDWFIPQTHAELLYDIAKTNRPKDYPVVKYIGYGKEHGLGHFIHSHLPIYEEIKKMVDGQW